MLYLRRKIILIHPKIPWSSSRNFVRSVLDFFEDLDDPGDWSSDFSTNFGLGSKYSPRLDTSWVFGEDGRELTKTDFSTNDSGEVDPGDGTSLAVFKTFFGEELVDFVIESCDGPTDDPVLITWSSWSVLRLLFNALWIKLT